MRRRAADLAACLPAALVTDDAVIGRDESVTIGWELVPSQEGSLPQDDYDALTELMCTAFRSLPDWTLVHRQDIYRERRYGADPSGRFLDDCYGAHFEGQVYLSHSQYIWFSSCPLAPGAEAMMTPSYSGASLGRRSAAQPLRDLASALSEFEAACHQFMTTLCSTGHYSCRRLLDADLEGSPDGKSPGLLDAFCSWFDPMGQKGDVVHSELPFLDRVTRRMMCFSFCSTDDMPQEVSNTVRDPLYSGPEAPLMLSSLAPVGQCLGHEHMVNCYYLKPASQQVYAELDRRRRSMVRMASDSRSNKVNSDLIEEFLEKIHSESSMAVYAHFNVFVWGDRGDEMRMRSDTGAALSQMGLSSKMESVGIAQLWLSAMPGGQTGLGRDSYMLCELSQAFCLSLHDTFTRSMPGGPFRLSDRRRGVPLGIDLQDGANRLGLIDSFNQMVVGASGAGKSFYMNKYLSRCHELGQHVFIIDRGDSYEVLCSLIREQTGGLDGSYLRWDPESPFCFNPLAGCEHWDEPGRRGRDLFVNILRSMWTPQGGWDAYSTSVLERIMDRFLSERASASPLFGDFYDYVCSAIAPAMEPERYTSSWDVPPFEIGGRRVTAEDFPVGKFTGALAPYARGGRYSSLFNTPDPPDLFTNRFTVFEMDSLDETRDPALLNLCVLCLLDAFDTKMRSIPGFKTIVIDEAWKAIATPSMSGFIQNLWKTARKYHASAVVVTQQVSDIKASEVVRDAIIVNSPVRIILEQKGDSVAIADISEVFSLTSQQRAMLSSLGRHRPADSSGREVLVRLGGTFASVYRIETSEEEAVTFESDKRRKAPILLEARRTGSTIAAIRHFAALARRGEGVVKVLDRAASEMTITQQP